MAELPFFYNADITTAPEAFDLDEATARHCVQVLRMQPGEQLNLTNGKGLLATAVITHTGKRTCTVSITASGTRAEPKLHTTIAISLLKNTGRFEWFLEKAAELGISEIIPLQCRRTEKQQFRHDRMQQILVSAMLQSRQTHLVQLHPPTRFEEAVKQQEHAFIAHCYNSEKKELNLALNASQIKRTIFIGPEGDFTEEEIAAALALNYTPVSLGATRLRTETAGIAAAVWMVG